MKNLTCLVIVAVLTLTLPVKSFGLIANDNAANYSGSWSNGNNFGSGFGAWNITSNDGGGNFAGSFIGSSTSGAGDINTGGVSFGLYANPGAAFINADRNFSTPLLVGDIFTFQLGVNFDNGNKGFNLYSGSGSTQLFNFNIGGGAQVAAGSGLTLNPGTGAGYNYGGAAVLNITLDYSSINTLAYSISRTSPQGNQGTLFSGTVTGTFAAPDSFRFYNSGTDAGGAPENNLYMNNLNVVPEPRTLSLFILGALGVAGYIWNGRAKARSRQI